MREDSLAVHKSNVHTLGGNNALRFKRLPERAMRAGGGDGGREE
jgi:hypothetical protein